MSPHRAETMIGMADTTGTDITGTVAVGKSVATLMIAGIETGIATAITTVTIVEAIGDGIDWATIASTAKIGGHVTPARQWC